MARVLSIQHVQSISLDANGRMPETVRVSVSLFREALTTGWLREKLQGKGKGTDLMTLFGIALHARPLEGKDLDTLIALGAATPDDEGRLYCWITDCGLADELGVKRQTVASSAERLRTAELLDILEVPDFRPEHGHFAGTKVYILSGELEQVMDHQVLRGAVDVRRPDTDHVRKSDTVARSGDGVRKSDTDRVPKSDMSRESSTHGEQRSGITVSNEGTDGVPESDTKTTTTITTPSRNEGSSSSSPLLATQPSGLSDVEAFEAALEAAYVIWEHAKGQPPSRVMAAMLRRLATDYDTLAREGRGYFHWPSAGGAGWIVAAITEAIAAGVEDDQRKRARGGLSAAYVRTILERWREQGGLDEIYASSPKARCDTGTGVTAPDQWEVPESWSTVSVSEPEADVVITREDGSSVSMAEVWQRALGELQLQMTVATFDTWLKDTKVLSYDNNTFNIEVGSEYARDWVSNRLMVTVERTLRRLVGRSVEVRFVVRG